LKDAAYRFVAPIGVIVNFEVPAKPGVPLISPLKVLSANPRGNAPALT
jgi:hypothetical protein